MRTLYRRSKVSLRLTFATQRQPPQAFRAVVATPALQALAKRAGEVWMRLRDGGSRRLIGPSDADLLSLSQGSSSCEKETPMELTEAERRRIREAQLRFGAPPSSCEVRDIAVERDVHGVDGEEPH